MREEWEKEGVPGRDGKVWVGEGEKRWRGWRNKAKNSCLWKHNANDHDGKLGEDGFKMKILSKPRRALQRQVEEAIRILEEEPDTLMNSKSGYRNNKIPRISVMMGDEEVTRRKDQEEKKKREEEKQAEDHSNEGEEAEEPGSRTTLGPDQVCNTDNIVHNNDLT